MKPLIQTALAGLAAVLALTGTVAAKPLSGDPRAPAVTTTDGAPVDLAARPGSEADKLARQLMAPEIQKSRAYGDEPLVLVGMGRLNDVDEMLFVQLQSPADCGSAGCSTLSFKYTDGQWMKVLDTVGGPMLIARTGRNGMPDLIMQGGQRLMWNGRKYVG